MDILVKTLHGLEGCLANELRNIGADNVKELKRAVSCTGNLALIYRANYTLRTGLRVLIPLHTFKAKNENEFYRECRKFDWDDHIELRQTFAIDHSIGKNASLKHSQFASLKLKDAIVDHFRDKKGRRPSVNPDNPDILLNLHGFNDEYTISLDSSGKPLNQRGYRKPGHQAPMNEVLAAGLLAISDWDKKSTFLDPMCGSGTIALEAALLAKNIPSQILRSDFGFMNWSNFNAILWNRVKHEAAREQVRGRISIYASDLSVDATKLVKHSAKLLKLGNGFEIDQRDFLNVASPANTGMILTNPPYGERIGGDNVGDFYVKVGDKLKQDFAGWDAWVISSNFGALRSLRLGPSEKHILFNGKLECQYCKYEMYKGSKN